MSGKKEITRTSEQLQAADPSHSVWVMANAGSGKTHVLVDRVVRLLLAGFAPQSILCLTFTKAAAAEMSLRLFKLLSSWIALDDAALVHELRKLGATDVGPMGLAQARRLFATAIETPGGLKIQTIHAFCEKLLQLFPVESGLAPGFRVMDDADRKALLEEARVVALGEAAADGDDSLLLLEDGLISTSDAFEALAKMFLPATSVFRESLNPCIDEIVLDSTLRRAVGLTSYASTAEVEADFGKIDRKKLSQIAAVFSGIPPYGSSKFDVHAVLRDILSSGDTAQLVDRLFVIGFTKDGPPRGKIFKDDTRKKYPDICAELETFKGDVTELLEKHALSRKIDATLSLIRLMRRVNGHFLALKQQRGLYDFDDLIMRTRVLLQESGAAQWVLYKLDANLSHILVDEAQDTSPHQWAIIRALAEEFFAGAGRPQRTPRTVFVVGDIKQSIYSFQGADTDAFTRAREFFRQKLRDSGEELHEIDLTISYRSLPAVLEMVDVVFAQGAPATKGLKQDDGKDRPHVAERTSEGLGLFEFWPPFMPADKEERDNWQAPVDREQENAPRQRLAVHVAETIANWIGKRLLPAKGRTVEAGDILILLQKRGILFDALIAELRQRGIAVAGADRLKLQDSLAVMDLMALMQFCLLPEDDLSLACVLKSPLLPEPLNDDDLTGFAPKRSGNLWQALVESGKHPSAVARLQGFMKLSSTAGPHGFLAAAITQSRRAMVARLGVEAQDATDVLLDVALSFERDQGTSLAAFLHWFMARVEDVKRDLEGPGNQVRLMTVHGAKGLEANIVILPDATDLPGPRGGPALLAGPGGGNGPTGVPLFNADTYVKPQMLQTWRDGGQEKSHDERKRLLYVAMTRARDELYIAGAQGERRLDEDSWYSLVKTALDATDKDLRRIAGQHPEGEIRRWGEEPQFTATTAGKQHVASSHDTLPGWATAPAPRDDVPSHWRGVTRLAAGSSTVFDKVAAQRGLAIHRVLERLRQGDSRETVLQRLARQKLEAALAEPLLALVSNPETAPYFAPEAQSEAAIAGVLEGLPKVQGRVDRLLITPEAVWVVDFKSGRKPVLVPPDYLGQMALYAAVLAEAFPGRAVKAALLWTQDAELVALTEKDLSQALDRLRREQATLAT